MKNRAILKAFLLLILLSTAVVSAQAPERPPRPGGRGVYGDWDLKVEFDEWDMDVILSFSRDEEGALTADWISFWGVNRLRDVKFEDGKLSFLQVVQFRDDEFRSTFSGTIEDDELKGVLSGERGDSDVRGKRSRRASRAEGHWQLQYKIGERDIASVLMIRTDKDGDLVGEWKAEQAPVESDVSGLNYQRGTLTFKRKSKMNDRSWESDFEGTIDRQTGLLSGVLKSERGEVRVEGKRLGEPLIGAWDLDITMDERQFKQRLRVHPDLSALYGTLPVEKVEMKDDKVTFKAEWEFGDRTFEMAFEGKLTEEKLTGEITTSRGTQKVEGKKIVPTFRRRS